MQTIHKDSMYFCVHWRNINGRKERIEARAEKQASADDGTGQCYRNGAFLWLRVYDLPDRSVGNAGVSDWWRGDLFYHADAGGNGCG